MLRRLPLTVIVLLAALTTTRAAMPRPPRRPKPVVAMPGTTIFTEGFEKGLEGWTSDPKGAFRWIDDPKEAHAGRGCITSKVDGDRRANFLNRDMPFSKTSIYRFSCWARSTHPEGKLVLWRRQGTKRTMMGSWKGVGKRWRKYDCQFTVAEGGTWAFQIIAPSSHGAPPCTMWVDDIALIETKMAPSVNLTGSKGYNTDPVLAVDGEGTAWLSWLSHQEAGDVPMVGRLGQKGESSSLAGAWPVGLPKGSYVLGTTLVGDAVGATVVCAAEVGKNWDIYVCRVGSDGPATPRPVTRHAAVDAKPDAALVGGTLWVAWESNRDGARQVYVSPAASPKPLRVSREGVNSYCPALAEHQGAAWIVWHAYVDGNYDLYGRTLKGDGQLGPVVRLTRDAHADRHARLVSCSHGLWVAWQKEIMPTGPAEETRLYRTGVVQARQTWLARWSANGLQPAADLKGSILPKGTEMPALAVDAQSRIWVTARRGRSQSLGWDSVLQCYAGGAWGEARHLSLGVGWDGRGAIAIAGDRALVAYQVGRTPSFPNAAASVEAKSDIHLSTIPLAEAPKPSPMKVEPLVEDAKPHRLALLRKQLGEETPRRSITHKGQKLTLWWGDFHEHTSLSQCNRWKDTSPDDNYANERDIVAADFSAMTDHGYNFNAALWNHMAKINRINHDPARFVTFLAEEWTSTHEKYSDKYPEGFYGHRNLIFANAYFPRWYNARDESTPPQIWADLAKRKANFVMIPHQLADTGNVPTDWGYTDKVAQPVAEIFQARQSYEYEGAPRQARRTLKGHFIQDAWAKGVVIGVIASPDHGGGQGKAAIYAPELTRDAILNALRARRCYGTTAARIFLDVRINGRLMGEEIEIPRGQPLTVTAKAIGANDIASIDLCRSNKFIYTKPGKGTDIDFTFTDLKPLDGRSYYYVRVQQKDGELAWTSPVWVTRQ